MLRDWTLNEMNEDELRNYAHHQNEVEMRYGELVFSLNDQIESLEEYLRKVINAEECLKKLNLLKSNFVRFEDEMIQKYGYAETENSKIFKGRL